MTLFQSLYQSTFRFIKVLPGSDNAILIAALLSHQLFRDQVKIGLVIHYQGLFSTEHIYFGIASHWKPEKFIRQVSLKVKLPSTFGKSS